MLGYKVLKTVKINFLFIVFTTNPNNDYITNNFN